MKKPILFLAAAVLAAGAVPAFAQEMDEAAMMKAWTEFMTPGAPHAELAGWAGEWNVTMKMWQDPSAPAMETTGKVTKSMILGGRYLSEEVEANVMGMPMKGMGLTGYNNQTKEYESIWIDTMGTGMLYTTGTKEGDKITLHGEYPDPMTGGMAKVKMTMKIQDADHYVFEYWQEQKGEMMKGMEGHYSRAGSKDMGKGEDEGGW